LSGTVVLRERWPVFGGHEQAATWLQIWTDLGRAPRTIDAYARGLAEYLLVCEREGVDPVTANRAHVAVFVRELTSRPRCCGAPRPGGPAGPGRTRNGPVSWARTRTGSARPSRAGRTTPCALTWPRTRSCSAVHRLLPARMSRSKARKGAQRELVHAQHPGRCAQGGVGHGADQPDQRHPAHPGR
jgi:hypothetical protein